MKIEELRNELISNMESMIAYYDSQIERCRENIKYDTQCLKEARQEGYTEDIEYWINERKNDYKELQNYIRSKTKKEHDLIICKIGA